MSDKTTKSIIPDALRNFDSLPGSANVRIRVLQGLYSCSPATIWRRVRSGEIPSPRKFSRITAWNVAEIRQNLAQKQAEVSP